jgi:hypothetical protein
LNKIEKRRKKNKNIDDEESDIRRRANKQMRMETLEAKEDTDDDVFITTQKESFPFCKDILSLL